jgi:hypothetical protein
VELLGGTGNVLIALRAIYALAQSYSAAEIMVLTLPLGGSNHYQISKWAIAFSKSC